MYMFYLSKKKRKNKAIVNRFKVEYKLLFSLSGYISVFDKDGTIWSVKDATRANRVPVFEAVTSVAWLVVLSFLSNC